jgi:hypothetical protein
MTFKPTKTQRSVLHAIKFTKCSDAQPRSNSIDTMRVTAISALFADCDTTTVEIFSDQHEADLLRHFWLSMRANDRIFAANVAEGISMLRRRAWDLDVLPSPEIDLRSVYDVEMLDTGTMWATGYIPYPLHTEQPDTEIEVEDPFDEAFDELTVHSREETVRTHGETVHAHEETVHSRD